MVDGWPLRTFCIINGTLSQREGGGRRGGKEEWEKEKEEKKQSKIRELVEVERYKFQKLTQEEIEN